MISFPQKKRTSALNNLFKLHCEKYLGYPVAATKWGYILGPELQTSW